MQSLAALSTVKLLVGTGLIEAVIGESVFVAYSLKWNAYC